MKKKHEKADKRVYEGMIRQRYCVSLIKMGDAIDSIALTEVNTAIPRGCSYYQP